MSHSGALALVALVASTVLLVQLRGGAWPIVAAVVSGVETLLAFGVVRINFHHLPLALIFGGVLALIGIVLYVKVANKHSVAAATVLVLVGAIQLLHSLHVL
jgi:hypothetical protein